MSELNITIPSGKKKRLLTAGKYCEDNIVVTAEESGIATLYGTYVLKETIPEFTSDWHSCDFTEEDGIFSFFLEEDGKNYVRRPVAFLGCGQDGMDRFYMYAVSEQINPYSTHSTSYMDYDENGSWNWRYYANTGSEYPMSGPTLIPQSDNRYRIIDFTKPVDVTSEFYNTFMLCVDNADITAFDIGHDVGYQDGHQDGEDAGRTQGYDDGYEEGYDHGRVSGYGAGYDDGYEAGYAEGEAAGGGIDYPRAEDHAF